MNWFRRLLCWLGSHPTAMTDYLAIKAGKIHVVGGSIDGKLLTLDDGPREFKIGEKYVYVLGIEKYRAEPSGDPEVVTFVYVGLVDGMMRRNDRIDD